MNNDNHDHHKLTNSLLSPIEAQRLAMNIRMVEQARKDQAKMPIWLIETLLIFLFLYLAVAFGYMFLYC